MSVEVRAAAPSRQASWLPLALLVATGGLIGAFAPLAKVAAADGVPALAFVFWMTLGGGLLILAIAAVNGQAPRLGWRCLRYFFISGFLTGVAPNVIMAFAVPRIGASLLSIVYTLPPMLTYLFALTLGMERRSLLRAAGIGLGLAGALMIVLPENSLPAPELYGWMALAFSIPVIVAVGNIYRQLDWPTGAGALPLASGMLLAAAVELVPVILITGDWYWPLPPTSVGDWTLLIQMAATALSFILYFELQRRAGVVYFSQIGYVVTLSGVLIGMLAFGERLSPWVWGAVVLMAGGLYLVNRRPPAPAA